MRERVRPELTPCTGRSVGRASSLESALSTSCSAKYMTTKDLRVLPEYLSISHGPVQKTRKPEAGSPFMDLSIGRSKPDEQKGNSGYWDAAAGAQKTKLRWMMTEYEVHRPLPSRRRACLMPCSRDEQLHNPSKGHVCMYIIRSVPLPVVTKAFPSSPR